MAKELQFRSSSLDLQPPAEPPEKERIKHAVQWMREQFPLLLNITVVIESDESFEGGSYQNPNAEHGPTQPTIFIAQGDHKRFETYKKKRPLAIELMARLLGTTIEDIDGDTIRLFILFHEFGHMYDLMNNYVGDDQNFMDPDVLFDWEESSNQQLLMLPFPGIAPAILNEDIATSGGFEQWKASDAFAKEWCNEHAVTSAEELIQMQDAAYRELPYEKYADMFAAENVLRYQSEAMDPTAQAA